MLMSNITQKIVSLIPEFIRKDILRKLIALFFAILVWISVSNQLGKQTRISNVEPNIAIPVNLVNIDEKKPNFTLTISASEKRLSLLSPTDFKVNLKVHESDFHPEEPYKFIVTPEDIEAPYGVRVLAVEPKSILVNIDRTETKPLKVKAKFSGTPPTGFTVGKVILEPDEVKITGPKSLVSGIKTLQTSPIVLDKYTVENFEWPIPVQEKHKSIVITPPTITARVEIIKALENKVFRVIPIRVLEPLSAENLDISPLSTPHVDVEIKGPKNTTERIKPEQIKAYIDLSPFREPGSYNVEVNCWVTAKNITVQKITPPRVKISITKKD